VKWPTSLALTAAAPASILKRPLRLLLAGVLLGLVHDRRPMREAQVDPAIRWVIGHALHEARPAHAHPPALRRHVFRRVFTPVVRHCQAAGLVSPRTVPIDASLIRANVGMDARVAR
jgi:hypothetical protein